jgi:carbamoylphosphate synthase small subunit
MINGFEEYTVKLSKEELTILPTIVYGLQFRIGSKKAVTNKEIEEGLKKKGINISAPRIRKIVNYIRNKGYIEGLVATSKGYYITMNPEEVRSWINSLESRNRANEALIKKGELYLMKLLNK